MAYLQCSNILHKSSLDESLTTMGAQFLHGLKSIFDIDSYFDDDRAWSKYMERKREHFNEYHTITPALKAKLQTWVRRIPGALILPKGELDRFLDATNTEKRTSTAYVDAGGVMVPISQEYDYEERNEVSAQRRARASNAYNSITNATCSYRLDMGGGKQSLLFITFDSDSIKQMQCICTNKYSKGGMNSGITAVKIPEWKTVRREEYAKH